MQALHRRTEVEAYAPGRVNLVGEHTDYNDGLALAFALDRGVTVRAAPAARLEVRAALGGWEPFVEGTLAELRTAGHDVPEARLEIAGDVAVGAGLASSAALGVALALALLALAEEDPAGAGTAAPAALTAAEVAGLCARVEARWAGAETGLLDQLTALHGREGCAVRLDLRTLAADPVPLDLGAWSLVVLDSGVRHSNAAGGYARRREECRAACTASGVASLRDASVEHAARLPGPLDRRVRHVLTENARVDAAVEALHAGDLPALGRVLDASHASLRDDYEVSVPEVEAARDRLLSAGAAGARIMGGGFGGAVLGLLPPGAEVPSGAVTVAPAPGARVVGRDGAPERTGQHGRPGREHLADGSAPEGSVSLDRPDGEHLDGPVRCMRTSGDDASW